MELRVLKYGSIGPYERSAQQWFECGSDGTRYTQYIVDGQPMALRLLKSPI